MRQIINLAIIEKPEMLAPKPEADSNVSPIEHFDEEQIEDKEYEAMMVHLKSIYSNKLTFNQKEAAEILNVSYQFVNKCCKTGQIKTVKFGDRAFINIIEIAKLLTKGIPHVD